MSACAARDLARDSRGAIMIMGVFMACIIVAAMWYLAGLGDALLFRERAQEAADAAAFGAAALHARGMHVLVLLNLTMAMILAVRVALKAIFTIAAIAATVFGVICAIPLVGTWACPIEAVAISTMEFTQSALNSTRAPIDTALRALNQSQTVVAHVIPPAAIAASLQVGQRYKDGVKLTVALSSPTLEIGGLPVEDGKATKLCGEAGRAIGGVIGTIFGRTGVGGKLADFIGGALEGIVRTSPGYFCEIPGVPDAGFDPLEHFRAEIEDAANKRCDGQRDEEVKRAQDSAIAAKKDPVMAGQVAYAKFDLDLCKQQSIKESSDKITADTARGNRSPSRGGGQILPKRLTVDGGNGCSSHESVGVAEGNRDILAKAPHLVALGYTHDGREKNTRGGVDLGKVGSVTPDAWSQAEYFYDCEGAFEGHGCNGDEEALWHFHWRPRLRLWNAPFEAVKAPVDVLETLYQAKVTLDLAGAAAHVTPENAALMKELGSVATSSDVFIH